MRNLIVLLMAVLLSSCKDTPPHYNGYIDADLTYLSSNFSGRLVDLAVFRGDTVIKDQPLFKLEQTGEQYEADISQYTEKNLIAQRQQLIDKLHYNETNYRRTLKMNQHSAASQNSLDLAKQDLDVLKEQLNAIDFQIKSSLVDIAHKKWQIARKEGSATDAGIVFDTYYTKDEYVQAGQPVLALITKRTIKVIFYVAETALSHIVLNQKVTISSDGNPTLATGRIRYISNIAQYTPPIIYSREQRQELVFRVEAKIDSPDLNHIHLGQPVSLELLR